MATMAKTIGLFKDKKCKINSGHVENYDEARKNVDESVTCVQLASSHIKHVEF
jgi:hypothetical protein